MRITYTDEYDVEWAFADEFNVEDTTDIRQLEKQLETLVERTLAHNGCSDGSNNFLQEMGVELPERTMTITVTGSVEREFTGCELRRIDVSSDDVPIGTDGIYVYHGDTTSYIPRDSLEVTIEMDGGGEDDIVNSGEDGDTSVE